MKYLLAATAAIEAATGVGLIAAPSGVVRLLLGSPLETYDAVTLARVAGAGLFALGMACLFAQHDSQTRAARGLVTAVFLYNVATAIILGLAGIKAPPVGIALWPAVGLHAVMAVWCVASLVRTPTVPPKT